MATGAALESSRDVAAGGASDPKRARIIEARRELRSRGLRRPRGLARENALASARRTALMREKKRGISAKG